MLRTNRLVISARANMSPQCLLERYDDELDQLNQEMGRLPQSLNKDGEHAVFTSLYLNHVPYDQ